MTQGLPSSYAKQEERHSEKREMGISIKGASSRIGEAGISIKGASGRIEYAFRNEQKASLTDNYGAQQYIEGLR